MKAPFKYSGGKSREVKRIKSLMPSYYDRVIEPFAGSGALSFALEKPSILIDIRKNNIDLLETIRDDYDKLISELHRVACLKTEDMEKEFYRFRDKEYQSNDKFIRAVRWMVLRQLCFSGMDRINSKGKFNVPFGWYKKMTINLTKEHKYFLENSLIIHDDWSIVSNYEKESDFVFYDPPYYNRNSEYGGDYEDNEELHLDIADQFKASKAKNMIVHVDCDLYRDIYKDFNIHTKDFNYSQNFKGRDNSNSKVQHLYITNYEL